MRMIKDMLKRGIGAGNLGRLDFFRHPERQYSWGGPFNGQKFRRRIVFDLLFAFPIKAVVETGTFRGTTTALFAATSLPVYSAEIHPRYFSYAKTRFLFNRHNVHLYHGDSRSFLRYLSGDSRIPKEDVFFYLDAHWGNDSPLRDELEIIFSKWERPIVMVDDFQVPDSGYGFDDYGPGKALNLDYIDPVVSTHNISVFFPSVDSPKETGGRRGSVVLCKEMSGVEIDKTVKTLVRDSSRRKRDRAIAL
ncbi:MAG: hypothetical protein ACRD5H_11020 [Nitrososphaerales archaeon]